MATAYAILAIDVETGAVVEGYVSGTLQVGVRGRNRPRLGVMIAEAEGESFFDARDKVLADPVVEPLLPFFEQTATSATDWLQRQDALLERAQQTLQLLRHESLSPVLREHVKMIAHDLQNRRRWAEKRP